MDNIYMTCICKHCTCLFSLLRRYFLVLNGLLWQTFFRFAWALRRYSINNGLGLLIWRRLRRLCDVNLWQFLEVGGICKGNVRFLPSSSWKAMDIHITGDLNDEVSGRRDASDGEGEKKEVEGEESELPLRPP